MVLSPPVVGVRLPRYVATSIYIYTLTHITADVYEHDDEYEEEKRKKTRNHIDTISVNINRKKRFEK